MTDNNVVPFSSEEVVLARTYIQSITQKSWGDEYNIECVKHRDFVTDDLMDQIKDLTTNIMDDMPKEVKLYFFSVRMDIVSLRMRLQGQSFKGYVRTSEAFALKFQNQIKNIIRELEDKIEKA
jgi:hypothetical protein